MTVEENKTEQAQSQEQATQAPKQEAAAQPAPQQAAPAQPAPVKKMSTGKKVGIITGIVVAILVVCAGGFMIYQNQQKEAAKKEAVAVVDKLYSDVREGNGEFGEAFKKGFASTAGSLEQYGITSDDYYDLIFARLSAKQKGDAQISDDGKEVTVTYEVSNISFEDALKNYMTEVQTWASSSEAQSLVAAGDTAAVSEKISSMLKDAFKNAPMKTADVEFNIKKNDDGKWVIANMDTDKAFNAIFPGQDLS